MITNVKIKNFNNIPLSRSTSDNKEIDVPVKVIYKIYKPGDIIILDLFLSDFEKRVFVISNDKICEIVNREYVKDDKITNVSLLIINIKCTSGCSYFLAESIIIEN